jgi:hypothetical protein
MVKEIKSENLTLNDLAELLQHMTNILNVNTAFVKEQTKKIRELNEVISMLKHHWISPMEYYEATQEIEQRVERYRQTIVFTEEHINMVLENWDGDTDELRLRLVSMRGDLAKALAAEEDA